MAARKKQVEVIVLPESNYEKIKEEVIALFTGQEVGYRGPVDYAVLLRRTLIVLVAVYGISRVGVLRQLALSIVTTVATRWLAQKATDAIANSGPLSAR
jgi:hypothetical protein